MERDKSAAKRRVAQAYHGLCILLRLTGTQIKFPHLDLMSYTQTLKIRFLQPNTIQQLAQVRLLHTFTVPTDLHK